MTPVDQTLLADPENGIIGNCWQAAVASLLDLPLDDVPHFAAEPNCDQAFESWLLRRRILWVRLGLLDVPADLPCLLVGTSPRGIAHMVVARGLKMTHDPHPSRDGLSVTRQAWALAPYL